MTQYEYKLTSSIGDAIPDPFTESSTQLFPLGSKLEYGDRKFRYAQIDSAVTSAGLTLENKLAIANHRDLVVAAASAGAKSITVTLGATAATLDYYNEGYIHINEVTGQGQLLRIKDHPAADSEATLVLTLYDPLKTAITPSSKADLISSNYKSINTAFASHVGVIVGVSTIAMIANYYGWIQTSGPCSVLTSGTLVLGQAAVRSDTTAGAVEPGDPANGPNENMQIGQVLVVNGNTDNSVINLNIE
jgi:hypothetical protein